MKQIGIYKVTSPNGRIYIGQSIDMQKRFNSYKKLTPNVKSQTLLYRSFLKYGVENHRFEILIECEANDLNDLERFYQDLYNVCNPKTGLNCRLTSASDRSPFISLETRRKLRIVNSKLNPSKCSKILKELIEGKTVNELSKKYNVHRTTLSKIKSGNYVHSFSNEILELQSKKEIEKEISKNNVDFIKENYEELTISEISKILDLSCSNVANIIHRNNLQKCKSPKNWTENEIIFLKENYKNNGDTILAEMMNKLFKREIVWTKKNIEKKRGLLGLKRTKDEIFTLRSFASKRKSFNQQIARIKGFPIPEAI